MLHPALRAEWFRTIVPKKDGLTSEEAVKLKYAQQEAVDKAETLLRYVAQSYHEKRPFESTQNTNITPSQPSSSTMSNGWFEEMLNFDLSAVPASVSATPQELLNEEIRRYLKFEGGRGEILNPLAWWKVIFSFSWCDNCAHMCLTGPCRFVPYHFSNGSRFPRHSCHKCLC